MAGYIPALAATMFGFCAWAAPRLHIYNNKISRYKGDGDPTLSSHGDDTHVESHVLLMRFLYAVFVLLVMVGGAASFHYVMKTPK